jgi:hypothetical protein
MVGRMHIGGSVNEACDYICSQVFKFEIRPRITLTVRVTGYIVIKESYKRFILNTAR